jgi:hypothetical protein
MAIVVANVRLWHLADNPVAPAFVRYWTKADNSGFSPVMVCPLMTQSGQNNQSIKTETVANDP